MSLLVIGSVAFDSIETPFGKRERVQGGSANYFSLSSSFFTPVSLVAVVGDDYPEEHIELLFDNGIDVSGLQREPGETFHWSGYYEGDMNEAITRATHLNVLESFSPLLSDEHRQADTVFLANIDPALQLDVLDQVEAPSLVACDTMNFWIHGKREELMEVMSRVDIFFANDQEVRDLSGEDNLLSAIRWIQSEGPSIVIVKRGEYGALLATEDNLFFAPAFPLEEVHDPTGAGDTFAGGVMGYLSQCDEMSEENLRRAVVVGSIMASFTVENFSIEGLLALSSEEITARYEEFIEMTSFNPEQLFFAR